MTRFRQEIEAYSRATMAAHVARIEAAALRLGYPDREAARMGRLGGTAAAVMASTGRQAMSFGEVQAELVRSGTDPCAPMVLDRALVAADAAKVLTYDQAGLRIAWPVVW